MFSKIDPVKNNLEKLEAALTLFRDNLNRGIVLNFFEFSDYFMFADDIAKFIRIILNRNNNGKNNDFSVEDKSFLLLYSCALYLYYDAPRSEQTMFMLLLLLDACEVRDSDESFMSDLDRLFKLLEDKNSRHVALLYYGAYKAQGNVSEIKYVVKSCKSKLAPLFGGGDNIFLYIRNAKDINNLSVSFIENTKFQKDVIPNIEVLETSLMNIFLTYYYDSEIFPADRNINNFTSFISTLDDDKINETLKQECGFFLKSQTTVDDIKKSINARLKFWSEYK